jgi:hypothetical protein
VGTPDQLARLDQILKLGIERGDDLTGDEPGDEECAGIHGEERFQDLLVHKGIPVELKEARGFDLNDHDSGGGGSWAAPLEALIVDPVFEIVQRDRREQEADGGTDKKCRSSHGMLGFI